MMKDKIREKWFFIFVIIGMIGGYILLRSIHIATYEYVRPKIIDESGQVMEKIYREVLAGKPRSEILKQLTEQEKHLLEYHKINWLYSMPVKTKYGPLNCYYLGIYHIVVYGIPQVKCGNEKWRNEVYYDGCGRKQVLRQFNISEKDYPANLPNLDKLITTTQIGTYEILLGDINDVSEIKQIESCDIRGLYKYLIIKQLINSDSNFLKSIIELVSLKDTYSNDWSEEILKKSVRSPELPDARTFDVNSYYNTYNIWYNKNRNDITFSNEFLFDDNNK